MRLKRTCESPRPSDGRIPASEGVLPKTCLVRRLLSERFDDLLFRMHLTDSPAARLRALPHLSTLGFTEPNAAGRQYRHGTPLPAPRLLEIFAAEPNHTTTLQ